MAGNAATSLRSIFAGRRGRLLAALLIAEFGGAVQSIAYSSVLPIAANDLHGSALYGATLAAGSFSAIFVLAMGSGPFARLTPAQLLGSATSLYVVGAALSVAAPVMVALLLGTVVRGLASGMLAGFGLAALGGLFDDEDRKRAYGLFATVWLLPSVAGPAVNAAVALAFGWRAALGWPVALVLLGRALIGRHVELLPWKRSAAARPSPALTTLLLGGLLLGGLAAAAGGAVGIALLGLGCAAAALGSRALLRRQLDVERARLQLAMLLFGLSVAFFGGAGIVSLAAVNGLGYGVVAGSAAVGAGLAAWSLTGLKPTLFDRLRHPTRTGLGLLAGGLLGALVSQAAVSGNVALGLLLASWFVAGSGMGIAYPRISSSAFTAVPPERLLPVASAVELAEMVGTAVGALVAGGIYSVGRSAGVRPSVALTWSFAILTAAASATMIASRRR